MQGKSLKEINDEMTKIKNNVLKSLDKQSLATYEAIESKPGSSMFTNKLQALNEKIETY